MTIVRQDRSGETPSTADGTIARENPDDENIRRDQRHEEKVQHVSAVKDITKYHADMKYTK